MASTGETWRLGRRPALDGIRGVAILLVLACHAAPDRFAAAGSVGVTLFFTLSGFLITSLLLEEWHGTGSLDLSRFFRRRARRLLPALVVAVSVFSVLWLAVGRSVTATVAEAVPILLYLGNWTAVATGGSGPLTHTWSLAVEEQFYLVWPLLVAVAAQLRSRTLLVWAALGGTGYAIVARVWLWDDGAGLSRVYMGSDTHADALLLGCLLAIAMHQRSGARRSRPVLALALVAVLVALSPAGNGFARYIVLATVVPLLAAALIYCVTCGGAVRWLQYRPLTALGRVSYGLYLWHYPLLIIIRPLLAPALGGAGSLALMMLTAAALTFLSWRYVEKPFLRARQPTAREVPHEFVTPPAHPRRWVQDGNAGVATTGS